MVAKELEEIVGSKNIFEATEDLEQYSTDLSFVNRVRPKSVIKVKNAISPSTSNQPIAVIPFWRCHLFILFSAVLLVDGIPDTAPTYPIGC